MNAVLALVSLVFAAEFWIPLNAFTFRGAAAAFLFHKTTRLHSSSSHDDGRQRHYNERKPKWKEQTRKRRDSRHGKHQQPPSLEYQRALESLANKKHPSIDAMQAALRLSTREQVHLIQELERSDKKELIVEVITSQESPQQPVVEAAVLALGSHQRYRSIVLQLCKNHSLSSNTFESLFHGVSSASEAATLIDQLQETAICLQINTVQVWNAAIYACRKGSNDKDDNTNWQIALVLLREMKRRHVTPNHLTYSHVLHACAQSGQVKIALSLLREMKPTTLAFPQIWGSALYACAKAPNGGLDNAVSILQYMQQYGICMNAIHVSAFLSTCPEKVAVEILRSFQKGHAFLLRNVTIPAVSMDLVVVNTVLHACKGNYTAAKGILEEMKRGDYPDVEPDVISYNTVLSACDDPLEAKTIVKEMRASRRNRYGAVPPTSITYTHAISSCRATGDTETARFFLELARNDGIEPNVYMYSAAIWCCRDDADAALELLQEMAVNNCAPNLVSYNGVISALATQGRAEEALSLLEEVKDNRLFPNQITFQKLASAIRASTEDIAKSEMLEHVLALMNPFEMRAAVGGPIFETLIRQYGGGGKYLEARHVFEKIRGPVDAKCLRAMLYACSACEPPRWEDALSLLHTSDIVEGTRGQAKVDSKALSYAMLACARADQWEEALNLAELYARSYSTRPNSVNVDHDHSAATLPAFNALMAACGRCGQPGVALRLLNDMETVFGVAPDQRSYRTVVIACNQAEHDKRRRFRLGLETKCEDNFLQWWECAHSLLRRMKENNIQVDPQTYSSVISACEAAGQWQRALGMLQSMMKTKGEDADEYSRLNLFCFNAAISACEKGGAWVEALELYYRMKDKGGPVTPNFVTLSSLLVALDKAGQKELAQSIYEEGVRDEIVTPWKMTRTRDGGQIRAMDLHRFSAAMANAATRSVMESLLSPKPDHDINEELVIIVGKGKGSEDKPVLLPAVRTIFERDYAIVGKVDTTNAGRFVIASGALQSFVKRLE